MQAISFEAGGFPSVELKLASSSGLEPLTLPQSLSQPSPDAIRRFQAAMCEYDSPEAAEPPSKSNVANVEV